jgi:nitroreductase
MKKIIEDLNWRYATKKYDPSKKLSEEQVVTIKESLRLTPTAYGLQALKSVRKLKALHSDKHKWWMPLI